MGLHVETTNTDVHNIIGLLSKKQITDYHQIAFNAAGLPDITFGGAPLGNDSAIGKGIEWVTGTFIWCTGCDPLPL